MQFHKTLMQLKKSYPEHFYPQDWYEQEEFANISSEFSCIVDMKPVKFKLIESIFGAKVPSAAICVNTFIDYINRGIVLWPNFYVWCSDRDSEGNRIYVGGYHLGKTKGIQIHRHLKKVSNVRYIMSV